ncbi:PQQ-dependent sugar dehydrogenase [Terrimonas sp. NA20]|uniref:PQQ-dependent sugar dehydrogenase n=1 Tax=Terrimonas ginsenosidimutans TaxID=2908004 RepID=A0ABS9KL36_9BACT|nr:PQQ-dependent sugar dehydrogenase [Terrimonas ginsenosidimutans]MCG2613024.1 PQQ-dependent sugar dehydrogenase [Terrimonas ginsenosidimutans]
MRINLYFFSFRALCTVFFVLVFSSAVYSQPTIGYMEVIPASAGLTQPIELASAPGDAANRFFIVQKTGEIRIWDNGALLGTPFLNINSLVIDDVSGEQGLLSMAFHPQYATNGFFYVYYNANNGNIVVRRYQRSAGDPDIADPTGATPYVNISKPFTNHNGGHLQFRVEGGVNYLYFATGDGGSGNDPFNNAQNPASQLGKILRVNVDAGSPTVETWGRGLRNPFRWSFDRTTGDMWIADVGQGAREEINYLPAASVSPNFGWPCREGLIANSGAPGVADCDTVNPVAINPIYDYQIGGAGRSVIGGYVYRGAAFPSLQGTYLLTDFFSNRLVAIQPNGPGWTVNEVTPTPALANIASISEDAAGELYAVSLSGGTVHRVIVPVVTPLKLTRFSGTSFSSYNELSWTAESEEGIIEFIVEYSKDGTNFSAVGQVASFSDGRTNQYSYKHPVNSPGNAYYRLRINEVNNSRSYSAVISIRTERSRDVKVYPTIVNNSRLNVVSGSVIDRVRISTISGQEVYNKSLNGNSGFFILDLPSLKKGFYVVLLEGEGERFTTKIIIE